MANGIPSEAIGVSVAVLLYSAFCFVLCFLVVCLLIKFGERWSYITLLASFTSLSTFASIVQQLHYATSWETIKKAQFTKAVKSLSQPALALQGAAEETDIVLFNIQFYCYNVMAMNIMFWAVGLFCGAYGIQGRFLGTYHSKVGPASKVFAVVFPGVIIGLSSLSGVLQVTALFFVMNNFTIFISTSVGSVLLIFILYKYVKTRRLVMGYAKRGGWWASASGGTERSVTEGTVQTTQQSGTHSDRRRSIYDRALLTRFSIGFTVLAVFEIVIVGFSLFQIGNNKSIAASGGPNFSIGNTIADILFFIPGVSASLFVFLVFGTTKSLKQYLELVTGCCGLRQKLKQRRNISPEDGQSLEFTRLDSLPNRRAQELEDRGKEVETRVRMFSIMDPEQDDGAQSRAPAMPITSYQRSVRGSGNHEALRMNPPTRPQSTATQHTTVTNQTDDVPVPDGFNFFGQDTTIGPRQFVAEGLPANRRREAWE